MSWAVPLRWVDSPRWDFTSFKKSYKNTICSYEKWASPARWDLTWFCRDSTYVRWKFFIRTRASGPAWQSAIEFSLISFVFFQMLIKEVRYNCSVHRSTHLFIIIAHCHIKRKQTKRTFLQYSCFLTMINVDKKYLWKEIHEENTLIGSSNYS